MKASEKSNRNQCMITSLDEMVDKNSRVRVIDAYVHSLDVEKLGYQVYTNKVGRPAYNPGDLIGLYLYSYMSRVLSSRKMEEQTYINVEIMWLLNGAHPDHSTIAGFRSKNAEALTNTFHDFTKICIDMGLVGKAVVAVDGTKIHANNNKKRNYNAKNLTEKLQRIDEQIHEFFQSLEENDRDDETIQLLEERKAGYAAMLDQLNSSDETQISTVDCDARLMDNKKGGLDVGYNIQATVEETNGLVIDQYVINTPTDQGELFVAANRAQNILSNQELTVLADKGYYNGEDLEKCFSHGITPIVARQKPPTRKGMFSLHQFIYNEETDSFICPNNEVLTRISGSEAKQAIYANKAACKSCPYQAMCFKQGGKHRYRRLSRDSYLKVMQKADRIFEANKQLYHRRQELSEHVFGSIKRQLGFPQLNVRTKRKVSGEVSLLFLGYNFKRVMNLLGNTELIRYFKERTNSVFQTILSFVSNVRLLGRLGMTISIKFCSYSTV